MLNKAISCFCYHEIPKIRPLENALAIYQVGSLPSFYFERKFEYSNYIRKAFQRTVLEKQASLTRSTKR